MIINKSNLFEKRKINEHTRANLDAVRRVRGREDTELLIGLLDRLRLEYPYAGEPRRGFEKGKLEGVVVQRTVQKKIRIRILFQNLLHYRGSGEFEPPGTTDQAHGDSRSEQLVLPIRRRRYRKGGGIGGNR